MNSYSPTLINKIMKFDPKKHHRHSIRLKGYDYSQPGGYFVTIVTLHRQCLFGAVEDGDMILNDGGTFARKCWIDIPNHFPNARLDEFIIMPNHIHGIIFIGDTNVWVQNLVVGVQKFVGVQNSVGVQDFKPLILHRCPRAAASVEGTRS